MKDSIFIIAEAGVNHNGKLEFAKKLAKEAKQAGADAVKFQTFKTELIVLEESEKAEYQKRATDTEGSQFDMLKKLELSYADFIELKRFCDEIGILFLSTPFDEESIDFLDKVLDIPIFKIPSGEITNVPYLEKVAKCNKPIILSTGMSTMDEIETVIRIIRKFNQRELTLLHCNTDYPTQPEDVNLRAIDAMRERFRLPVGYSDHTSGILVPIAATAMGALVIEKHFTLDKHMQGPDHLASLEPDDLEQMIHGIRMIEKSMGDGEKKPTVSEMKNCFVARKSIVAKRKIISGEELSIDNITTKRPGNGISALHWHEILGKRASRNYEADEFIKENLQ